MTDKIAIMRTFFIEEKQHHAARVEPSDPCALAEEFHKRGLTDTARAAARLCAMLDGEEPVLFPHERIVFTRTQPRVPLLFTPEEKEALAGQYRLHESGELSNISVDYSRFLRLGLPGMHEKVALSRQKLERAGEKQRADYLGGTLEILTALGRLVARYRDRAAESGNTEAAQSLERLLEGPPRCFRDALQLQRIIHFTMWCGGNYHNTLGRFDQYMFPWLEKDLQEGVLTEDSAFELLEEYFLTFNRDSDLYPGMQQGDNGQSMVLGGMRPDGGDGYNLLSELCLRASLELRLIDPKINLRVSKSTPLSIYRLGTELTKQGLGFPQYSNDDVVIPGLEKLGYETADARDYAVAACWEFIIPGKGMDVPNIDALCFPAIVRDVMVRHLPVTESYDRLFALVEQGIRVETERLCGGTQNLYNYPAPFLSLMMEGCVEQGRDVSLGCVYNNYGFHGTGLSTAADSLAAVKKYVYEEETIGGEELVRALETDFAGEERLLHLLRYEAPKMGNDDGAADDIAGKLLAVFADCLTGRHNDRGGVFRAGTGSAMYYVWHAKNMGATADGRRSGEGFSANYSPSLFGKSRGPVSVIKSFAKPDLSRTINGGPLTIELHDTLFRSDDSIAKVAALVKSFTDLGGHQLQINAVNRETMLDAQKHPENYRNLIVRVWGWSGYFVELDREYQDHIIQRMELVM